eukprot:gene44102-53917_t
MPCSTAASEISTFTRLPEAKASGIISCAGTWRSRTATSVDLDPERITSITVGNITRFDNLIAQDDNLQLRTTLFHNKVEDEIFKATGVGCQNQAINGGTIATASDVMKADLGIRDGRIAAIADALGNGREVIDATGRLVLPGGIDAHCHLDQPQAPGLAAKGAQMADGFRTGSISAACGGTTTIVPFCVQHRGQSLQAAVEDYHRRAEGQAAIDYAFHLIVSDPTPAVLGQELPALIRRGHTSLKVYMTYE